MKTVTVGGASHYLGLTGKYSTSKQKILPYDLNMACISNSDLPTLRCTRAFTSQCGKPINKVDDLCLSRCLTMPRKTAAKRRLVDDWLENLATFNELKSSTEVVVLRKQIPLRRWQKNGKRKW